jgi:hypothetical protein
MAESFLPFLFLLAAWAPSGASLIQTVADACTDQSEADVKRKCWRALLAGLWFDSEGLCRVGSSLEHEALSTPIKVMFDKKARLRDRALAITRARARAKADVKTGVQDIRAIVILWRTLPGRKLGMAVSHCDCSSQDPGEASPGWICLLPKASQDGDKIGILCGCPIPFVFRKDPDAEMYQVVGCCYVDNAMDGEIIEGKKEGVEWLEQDIILI